MRRLSTLLLAVLASLSLVFGLSAPAFAAPKDPIVARLTVYSDGSTFWGSDAGGLISGHAFVSIENSSGANITVGALSKIEPGEHVTVGTWGNRSEHDGVWYNLEMHFANKYSAYQEAVSVTKSITKSQLSKINDLIKGRDSYNALTNNCANFAADVWNSIHSWENQLIVPGFNSPTGLYYMILQRGDAELGKAIPASSRGVWYANGKKAPVFSGEYNEGDTAITFDEYSLGTSVTTQYISSKGVSISGDPGPVIESDGANPTSPVLSPGNGYSGTIDISFVNKKNPRKSATAGSISFDIGYMDDEGGATISWFAADGSLLGEMRTASFGMVRVAIPSNRVAKLHIDTRSDGAGAAIDNLIFTLN